MDALSGLEKLPANEEEFSNDANFRRQLGPGFHGTKTNWALLESAIEVHEFVYRKIGDLDLAKNLTFRLPKFLEKKSHFQSKLRGIRGEFSDLQNLFPISNTTSPDFYLGVWFDELKVLLSKHISELSREGNTIRAVDSDLQGAFQSLKGVLLCALEIRKCVSSASQFFENTRFYKRKLSEYTIDEFNALSGTLAWIQKVQAISLVDTHFSNWLFENETKDRYQSLLLEVSAIKIEIEKWINSISNLQKYGESDRESCFSKAPNGKKATQLHGELKAAISEIDLLLRWTDYQRSLRSLKEIGTIHILEFARQYQIQPHDLEIVADASFYVQRLKKLLRECPELWEFERVNHEVAREKFYAMDKTIPDIFCQEVAVRAHKSEYEVSAGAGSGSVTTFTDMALIRRELEKQRRHIPVRELVRRSHNALLDLMPCWMMGPGSVSQFLPPELIEFDLLIMDEASQIRPEDALGSLARAKQVVVVGDKNQMPPTDMFTTNLDGAGSEDDDSPVADMKSVLDNLTQYLQEESLIWHYRSQHHSLIQFSNSRYYDSKLIVPPSAYRGREDLGIKWHFVESPNYSNSLNPGEAEALIRHLSSHVAKNSRLPKNEQESIGLVVMNVKQRMLLEELWDRQLKDDDSLRKANDNYKPADPVFIKNLENVQGDERDVIVIGFTYGPDAQTGALAHRFGPINKDGGWRRLNVLFTRARKRVHVYSSMRASDIIPNVKEGKRGAGDLKAYLEFAESGKIPDFGKRTGKGPDSPFEVSVANIVSSLGYETHYQVGVDGFLVDIGVCDPKNPDFYLCGIECDGAPYHSHPVARDRDRLREDILRSRGWKIHRIWSTDWYRNRKTEIERLTRALLQFTA